MIESYRFGEIMIDGHKYTSDIIISPQGPQPWWRQEGHQVQVADVDDIISSQPEVVVLGTGSYGQVQVSPHVQAHLEARGIQLIAEATDRACQSYNRLCGQRRVVAALHLTC
ncbi:MAG: Mth938-like domain-containing protein [Dehalococcoidia bacterium]